MVAVVLTINCLNDSIILGETSLDVLIAQGIQLTTKDFVQYRGVCFCSLLVAMKISNSEHASERKRSLRGARSQANGQSAQGNN